MAPGHILIPKNSIRRVLATRGGAQITVRG